MQGGGRATLNTTDKSPHQKKNKLCTIYVQLSKTSLVVAEEGIPPQAFAGTISSRAETQHVSLIPTFPLRMDDKCCIAELKR